ncbi:MAG: LysM peptidoglycan-binding domain-containing protein [Nitrospira sp.]|nr:LysM peptidoglycan-binding domain-containing protein [Nitrospira sp.]
MMSGVVLMGMVACSPLEPLLDPERSDLQLTVDTLNSSLRNAQRTITELQTEVDRRRQSYADLQILRAQLEGTGREVERRLAEARRVVDLQREELARARSERERMGRTTTALQSQLRHLRKQLSHPGKQTQGAVSPASVTAQQDERVDATKEGFAQEAQRDEVQESLDRISSARAASVFTHSPTASRHVSVAIRPGDTLWSLARRHQTTVAYLMVINELIDDRIHVGQLLSVPMRSADAFEDEGM